MQTLPGRILPSLNREAVSLLGRVAYTGPVMARWKENADTASTNGATIWFPHEFTGRDLYGKPKTREEKIASGLNVHECGHFSQPLRECATVEQETGLNHWVVNIVLDIALERIQFKLQDRNAANNLAYMRSQIWRTMRADYTQTYSDADGADFEDQFSAALLIARFKTKGNPFSPFRSFAGIRPHKRVTQLFYFLLTGYAGRVRKPRGWSRQEWARYLQSMGLPADPRQLPDFLRKLAQEFPELCQPGLPTPDADEAVSDPQFDGGDIDPDAQAAMQNAYAGIVSDILSVYTPAKIKPLAPTMGALKLFGRLHLKARKSYKSGQVKNPVKFDRRLLAQGIDPEPYYENVSRGQSIAQHVTLVFDRSGSMWAPANNSQTVLDVTIDAMQAIAMVVKREGGTVCGAVFSDFMAMTKSGGDEILFNPMSDDLRRIGGGTNFSGMTEVWRRNPDGTVIIITDGDGAMPAMVTEANRDRTHVIVITPTDDFGQPVEIDAEHISQLGTVHKLASLDDLADVLADISLSVK